MDRNRVSYLIAKYIAGDSSSKENDELQQWLNSSNKNREEFNKITLVHQLSKIKVTNDQKTKVFSRIQGHIEKESIVTKKKRISNFRWNSWFSLAASILIFISIGAYYFINSSQVEAPEINGKSLITKSNPAGQKSKVFLPDGSIVWLNSESSVSYEESFNDSCRNVHLTGEGYFEVKKEVSRPFVVYSGNVATTALGTAFNVNAFDDQEITVSLTHGKVNVESNYDSENSQRLIINAGEGVVCQGANDSELSKIKIDPTRTTMWRNGLLLLENATLSETITTLERWYGVEIYLNNKPEDLWSANGMFDNEYLDNVLQSLSFSQDFDFEISGKQVFITFKLKMPM